MRTVVTADRLLINSGNGGNFLDQPIVLVEDGQIVSIGSRSGSEVPAGAQVLDFPGATLAPAYLDVHIHGAAGHDVMEATPEALSTIGRFLAAHGTANYLATTVTAPVDTTLRSLSGLAKWISGMPNRGMPDGRMPDGGMPNEDRAPGQAHIAGIHLEGPFISHLRRGVHPPADILEPDIALLDRMFEAAEGNVRLMTLAPELPGAIELARHAISRGVRVSVGHSNATAAETRAAIAAGAVSATHTFNAMRPFDHREPGIIGTVLTTDSLFAELICDGVHTAREAVRIWWRCKGPERAILVTDAMSATGMPDGMYRLGSMEVEVKDGKASAGESLAGSLLTLNRAVSNLVEFTGAPVADALRAVTANPAAMIGLGCQFGKLEVGQPATFVAVDAGGKLIASVIDGVCAFELQR
jgi:N-acetylglucosamine-6-phosphate deacetylase